MLTPVIDYILRIPKSKRKQLIEKMRSSVNNKYVVNVMQRALNCLLADNEEQAHKCLLMLIDSAIASIVNEALKEIEEEKRVRR